jgi:arylsulfatase A-like enzyme
MSAAGRPNFLYLHSHDTGRFVQPYGYPVPTPRLQRFAEQGVVFRQAFAVSPTCSPSRAALLTGQYPHACGMHGLATPPWNYRLAAPSRLLPALLAARGYATIVGGVHHVGAKSLDALRAQGFTAVLNKDNLCEDVPDLHERAAAFLRTPPSQPWFAAIGFDQTHRDNRQGNPASGTCFSQTAPYDARALDARYCRPPPTIPDSPETRRDLASFAEGARQLDERIGHVLAALDASGQAARTVVIVTTDHGAPFPGMKCTLSDHGLGVMLMVRGPGGFDSGRVVDAMVTHLDLLPTLAELAGGPGAVGAGKSLLPLVRGETTTLHDEIFAEQSWHDAPEPQRAVRTTRYKLIRRFDPTGPKAANCDEGPTKNVMASAGFFDRELGRELLFDLHLDPQETCNRIGDYSLAGVRAELRTSLDDWMRQTNDPLLSGGPVPPPGLRADAEEAGA